MTSARTNEGVAATEAPAQCSTVIRIVKQGMRYNAARRTLLCGSETAAKCATSDSSNLARPRLKLLLMPRKLKLPPALECAVPGKAEVVVVQSVLRRADGAEANGAGFRSMQNMPAILYDLT